jgi:putative addiction module component (TIGR02574 family)
MALAFDELEREALQFPAEARLYLAERLFSSISVETSPEIDAAWYAEIDRRFQAIQNGTVKTENAYEVLARIRATLEE